MTDKTQNTAHATAESSPADAMQAFYETVLQSAGTVVQNGAAYQAELNSAGGAMLTHSVTHMMAVVNAATARAVALMASSVPSASSGASSGSSMRA